MNHLSTVTQNQLKSILELYRRIFQFNNPDFTQMYFDEWEKVINSPLQYNRLNKETFCYQYNINEMKVGFNFNISIILEDFASLINKCNNFINHYEFTMSNRIINFTYSFESNFTNSPIILVPFICDNFDRLLVIDGNKRLSTQLRYKKTKINSLILPEKMFLQKNYFLTNYEYYLYILTNELNHILELKNTGVPEISLFNKRFLKKNKFSYPEFKFSWCN